MVWRLLAVGLAVLMLVAQSDDDNRNAPPGKLRAEAIPPRDAASITGSRFAEMTRGWGGRRRQAAAVDELLRGNLPSFLRELRSIELEQVGADGVRIHATVWVMPDYLAIGSDTDFLYIPLTLPSATRVANHWGMTLPTRKIVDAVYDQAEYRLTPIPLPPGPEMRSSAYYLRHQRLIDAQRGEVPPGTMLSGHKKDVVLTSRLAAKSDRIAIYGWHRGEGDPIQPLSTVHGARYADYSHGVRLVWGEAWIDGRMRPVYDLLRDPQWAQVLTYEGVIASPRKLMHAGDEPWAD